MPRTACMTKLHVYIPNRMIMLIKQMAEQEEVAFAELLRRCVWLGLEKLVADREAFYTSVANIGTAKTIIEAEDTPQP
jgi:hypothetical protein